jgi:hypothetical protein
MLRSKSLVRFVFQYPMDVTLVSCATRVLTMSSRREENSVTEDADRLILTEKTANATWKNGPI